MADLEDIRAVATPQDVAKYFLGLPVKERRNELWYKSPFRAEERTASFVVSPKGFHDFGTGEHFDIFSFVTRLKNCTFRESVDTLASIFGIQDRAYKSRELDLWYKRQNLELDRHRALLDWLYLRIWDEVDNEYRENNECLSIFKNDIDAYKICIDRQVSILGMKEHLAEGCDTWEEKEELMNSAIKGELPTWLMNRLKATMTLWDLNIKLRQKREY